MMSEQTKAGTAQARQTASERAQEWREALELLKRELAATLAARQASYFGQVAS